MNFFQASYVGVNAEYTAPTQHTHRTLHIEYEDYTADTEDIVATVNEISKANAPGSEADTTFVDYFIHTRLCSYVFDFVHSLAEPHEHMKYPDLQFQQMFSFCCMSQI